MQPKESSAAYWHDLHDLIAACQKEFAGAHTEHFGDDEDVMEPPSGITFGMIRRARAAHDALTAEVTKLEKARDGWRERFMAMAYENARLRSGE